MDRRGSSPAPFILRVGDGVELLLECGGGGARVNASGAVVSAFGPAFWLVCACACVCACLRACVREHISVRLPETAALLKRSHQQQRQQSPARRRLQSESGASARTLSRSSEQEQRAALPAAASSTAKAASCRRAQRARGVCSERRRRASRRTQHDRRARLAGASTHTHAQTHGRPAPPPCAVRASRAHAKCRRSRRTTPPPPPLQRASQPPSFSPPPSRSNFATSVRVRESACVCGGGGPQFSSHCGSSSRAASQTATAAARSSPHVRAWASRSFVRSLSCGRRSRRHAAPPLSRQPSSGQLKSRLAGGRTSTLPT